jgi:alcohol dehydrogenase class IV
VKTKFNFPTRILFGEGVVGDLSAELRVLGLERPLVVTDRGLAQTPIPGQIQDILKEAGFAFAQFDAVEPNPTDAQVEAGAKLYIQHQADSIIAVGGGSPIDAAKAIQIRINHHKPMEEYDDLKGGDAKITNRLPPLVAIPTTSGTGSEVSRSAVITIAAAGRKVVLFHPDLMPKVAICDPELTYGLPPRITAECGMDALSHNLEAYMAAGYHPMADGIALRGIRMVAESLKTAVEDGNNIEARRDMMMASSMGAVAFQKGLGVVHSLAHPLSSVSNVSHGLANSIMMPAAMRFNGKAVPQRAAMVAHALGAKDHSAEGAAQAIEELAKDMGLPLTLKDAGVTDDQIPTLVDKAMQDGCHGCNPCKCTPGDMEALFKAAM